MAQIEWVGGPNQDALTRALGANPLMRHKHYKSRQNQSYQRTLQVRDNMNSLTSDSDREARVAAGQNQMEEDSDVEMDLARNRKKKDEDDEEATAKTPKHKGVGKKPKN